MIDKKKIKNEILEHIDMSEDIDDELLQKIILDKLRVYLNRGYIDIKKYRDLGRELFNSFRKLDMLQDLIDDSSINEIMINGSENIFIEKNGVVTKSELQFSSEGKLTDMIQKIVGVNNRIVNEANPIVDTRLSDGSRVNVVLPPVSGNGAIVTIRKFPNIRITGEDLVKYGSITTNALEFLSALVKARYNIFISGGTGSGKTTLLNVLSDYIPSDERIIVIEDNIELQITNIPNIVRLESRNANSEGKGMVSIRQLIKASLRMRPDRIIVGEVRGSETIDMLQALNTGHDGSISTGHANNTKDMMLRLETMVMMGIDLPLIAIKRQIVSGLDIIVHLKRLRDGTRKVVEISEIIGLDESTGEILFNKIYEFKENVDNSSNIIKGELVNVGEITKSEKLKKNGISISY